MTYLLGCLLGVALTAAPVSTADEIGLSNDGSAWGPSLSYPLFDPDLRWIPGDDETASFYVRNQGPTGALLTIAVRSADTDRLIADDDVVLRARADGGQWVDLDNNVPSAALTERSIDRGDVVRVDVNVVFDPASTNQSQTRELGLDFTVTLAESLDGDDADDDDGTGSAAGTDGLPGTGSDLATGVVLVAIGLLFAGALVLSRRDREEVRHG